MNSTAQNTGIETKRFVRPMRPFEKAYIFWYIESLKPAHEQNQAIIQEKYAFGKRQRKTQNMNTTT